MLRLQLDPGRRTPSRVMLPVHLGLGPARSPWTEKCIGTPLGAVWTPGETWKVPVGCNSVPPQVHTAACRLGAAEAPNEAASENVPTITIRANRLIFMRL